MFSDVHTGEHLSDKNMKYALSIKLHYTIILSNRGGFIVLPHHLTVSFKVTCKLSFQEHVNSAPVIMKQAKPIRMPVCSKDTSIVSFSFK